MKYLFICGCPRSGTTALWKVISAHKQVAIGVERYLDKVYPDFSLTQREFLENRFMSLLDSNGRKNIFAQHPYYTGLAKRYNKCIYYGDKVPFLYENFTPFFSSFNNAIVIFILRNLFDVASSYKVRLQDKEDDWSRDVATAVWDWNTAITCTLDALDANRNIIVIEYENFFSDKSIINKILTKLDLSETVSFKKNFQLMITKAKKHEDKRENILDSSEKLYIQKNTNYQAYNKIIKYI